MCGSSMRRKPASRHLHSSSSRTSRRRSTSRISAISRTGCGRRSVSKGRRCASTFVRVAEARIRARLLRRGRNGRPIVVQLGRDSAVILRTVTQKWYKAAEVCEMTQLQPYVLRSWEKEFPGIGVQKSADSPRLYRQSDLDQVLRIKELVFREGLTLAGARRRIEEDVPPPATASDDEVEEVLEALASDARTRIAHVRDGLRSILRVLSSAPGTV